jgi:hypothetical protein
MSVVPLIPDYSPVKITFINIYQSSEVTLRDLGVDLAEVVCGDK